jgi:hypothetical protein
LIPGKERGDAIPLILPLYAPLKALLPVFRSNLKTLAPVFSGLLLQGSQDVSLFDSQDTPDSDFGHNPHTHRCPLGRRHVAHTLLDGCVIRVFRIERFLQRAIRLT